MENRFEKAMYKRSDSELLKIIKEDREDYQDEAVIAAEKELVKRNLSFEQVETAELENSIKDADKAVRANEKLSFIWKLLTFVFPGLFQIIFAATFLSDGYDTKAKELSRWTIYGFGFYFSIIVLILILNWLT